MKYLLILFFFITTSTSSDIIGQSPLEQKIDTLANSKNWKDLKEYTQNYLNVDTLSTYETLKVRWAYSHALFSLGEVRESFIETENIFNEYDDSRLVDTPMVNIIVNICEKLAIESQLSQNHVVGLKAVKRGLKLCEERISNNYLKQTDLYYNAATIYRSIDSSEVALEYILKGKETAKNLETANKKDRLAQLRNEEAIIYWTLNNLKMTKVIFNEELQIAIEDSNFNNQTRYHTNLGIANELLFDFGKSEYHYMKALETNKLHDIKNDQHEHLISVNLARVYSKLQRYDEALPLHQKSLTLSKQLYGESSPRVGAVYLALGNLYAKQKMYDDATYYYKKKIENNSQNYSKESTKYSDNLSDYGSVLILQNELDEGINQILSAVKNRAKLKLRYDPKLSDSYMNLASAYLKKNDIVSAKEYLDKSTSALDFSYEKDNYSFDKLDVPNELIGPLYMRYEYLSSLTTENTKDLTTKVENLDNIVDSLVNYIKYNFDDLNSRKVFVRDMQTLYLSRLELYDRLYESDNNIITNVFNLSERVKNTFLYEAKAEKNNNANALTSDIYNERQKLNGRVERAKTQLKKYLTSSNEEIDNNVSDSLTSVLTSAQNEHYNLIQNIKTNNPGYYSYVYDYSITNIESIQETLDEDEVVIIFTSSTNDQLAITISSEDKKLHNLGSLDTIELAANEYISYCKNPSQKPEFEHNLYNLLIDPLDVTQRKLNFVLDGVLSTIPMEALTDNNGEQLIKNFDINYNYSATLITDKNSNKKTNSGILAMAPVFDDKSDQYDQPNKEYFAEVIRSGNIIPLPGSLEEVKSIDDIFGGTILTQNMATKQAFLNNAKGKSIIHLATHGIINEIEPSLSGLMFNSQDEKPEELLVSDIIQMDLDADLVTLSACNTGSGKIINGEGVASLGRAFSYAGCANQVLSLWSVNDNSTTKIMTNYYRNIKAGQGKSLALKNAKLEYISSSPAVLQHPYYWAGFVYYGEDSPIDLSSSWGYLTMIFGLGIILFAIGYYFKRKR